MRHHRGWSAFADHDGKREAAALYCIDDYVFCVYTEMMTSKYRAIIRARCLLGRSEITANSLQKQIPHRNEGRPDRL